MSIINRRNAVVGWLASVRVGKRLPAEEEGQGRAAPSASTRRRSWPNKSAIALAFAGLSGVTLTFWRKRSAQRRRRRRRLAPHTSRSAGPKRGGSGGRRDPEPTLAISHVRRALRPSSCPLRVLDPRRGMPDPGARREGGRARDAGRDAHRPRLARGRGRAPPGGARAGVKPIIGCEVYVADDRHAQAKGYAHLTAPRRVERGLRQPDQALLARLPRGLLLQAARRLGAPRADAPGSSRSRAVCRAGSRGRSRRARPRRAATSTGSSRSSAGTRPTSSSRTRALRSSGSTRCSRSSPPTGFRSSPPATSTTSVTRTRARTRRSSASSRATAKNPNHWSSTPTSSLQDPGGDGRATSPATRRRCADAGDRRALLGRDRARPDPACRSSRPGGRDAFDDLVELCEEGLAAPLRQADPGAHRAAPVRAQDRSGRWASRTAS